MARFSPPDRLRLGQTLPGRLDVTFAGAEANVAVAVAQLGGRASFASALPANPLAEACLGALRAAGVEVASVVRSAEGRLGLYFVETGANQRGGLVIYDRDASAYALAGAEAYDFPAILADADWLHISGIAAGVSRASAEATLAAVRAAKAAGLVVSCDLNYRRKLWRWDPTLSAAALARRTHDTLLPHIDVLIGNPFDLADLLDEATPPDRLDPATATSDDFEALARRVAAKWPRLRQVAMTLRRNHSANHNGWGALLLDVASDHVEFAPTRPDGAYRSYEIPFIVDRVGTGDAFVGGLLFALRTAELAAPATALRFAVAASCLAHSVSGDFLHCTRAEVEALMQGEESGYVSR